jgi:hypothetical protein
MEHGDIERELFELARDWMSELASKLKKIPGHKPILGNKSLLIIISFACLRY